MVYTIVVKHEAQTREYNIYTEPIYKIGNVADSIKIENNKVYAVRKTQEIDGEISIRPAPVTEFIKDLNMELFEGINTIYIKDYEGTTITAEYLLKNEFTDTYPTRVEMAASIKVSADSINSEVKKKVNKTEIISTINQTAEAVTIDANKINLNGAVTANDNFKVLLDGSIEAKNGSFTGNIYLGNGNKVIGGDGLLTNLFFQSSGNISDFTMLGYNVDLGREGSGTTPKYNSVFVDAFIPDNFTIVSAYFSLEYTPAQWYGYDAASSKEFEVLGNAKRLKLYKVNSNLSFTLGYGSEYASVEPWGGQEITNAFGSNSYTPSNTQIGTLTIKDTVNVSNFLSKGSNKFMVRTADKLYPINTSSKILAQNTGLAKLRLNVIGYIKD